MTTMTQPRCRKAARHLRWISTRHDGARRYSAAVPVLGRHSSVIEQALPLEPGSLAAASPLHRSNQARSLRPAVQSATVKSP